MKNFKTLLVLFSISIFLLNCTNEETTLTNNNGPQGILNPQNINFDDAENYTVNGFGANSYWASYIVDQSTTNC